jgi:phosphatidylserine decarboxylase
MSSQLQVLNAVREANEVRAFSNREYIGALYFLIAVCMLQFNVGIAIIQSYVLPLTRFEHISVTFASPKWVTLVYFLLLSLFYGVVTLAAGMTGWIVSSGMLMLWTIALIIIGIIRRCIRSATEVEEHERAADPDQIPGEITIDLPDKLRKGKRDRNPWTTSPSQISSSQIATLTVSILLLVLLIGTCVIITYTWVIPDYHIVTTADKSVVEYQPSLTAKALQFMYAFPEMAQGLKLEVYVKMLTEYCGREFTKTLSSDADKKKYIDDAWIQKYDINMSVYVRPNYLSYTSANDWFVRAVNMSFRPVPSNSTRAILSPADCRMLVFKNLVDSLQWFKGYELDYRALIGNIIIQNSATYFEQGGMVIARLAPQDYHRFHAPLSGTITAIHDIPGTLWSVSADAARSGNQPFLNQRKVVIINAGDQGYVAYVAIGATCVGSVLLQKADGTPLKVGQLVDRGDQFGIMQFGGSTVVMLFARDKVVFDADLLYRSRFPVETLINTNEEVGQGRA